MEKLNIKVLKTTLSICKLNHRSSIPKWALKGCFTAICKNEDELSIVCEQKYVPINVKAEKNWGILKVVGQLDFALTGILSSIALPLAKAKISIFAISTFNTDYILIKKSKLAKASALLLKSGFTVK